MFLYDMKNNITQKGKLVDFYDNTRKIFYNFVFEARIRVDFSLVIFFLFHMH